MSIPLQAHYLNIEWLEPGRAREITAAPEPIEIDLESDGTMVAETQVFHNLCPWVGLRLGKELSNVQPSFEMQDGSLQSMLRIDDGYGGHWWVQNDGWDAFGRRHLSELHRSMGQFKILIGTRRLLLNNVVDGLGRREIEDYLHDFKRDLIWLVMGFSGATAESGNGMMVNQEVVEALEAFAAASRRVLTHPARDVREVQAESRVASLRPNAATFRQYLRNPLAQRLIGRGVKETSDIAVNRYLRYMVQACDKLAFHMAKSADRHALRFTDRASIEAERSALYQNMRHRRIDPDIFDHQLDELKAKLADVESYSNATPQPGEKESIWEFRAGNIYGGNSDQMFYLHIDGKPYNNLRSLISYSVFQVPEKLAKKIQATQRFCDHYILDGIGNVTTKISNTKKKYWEVNFTTVYSIKPISTAVTRKECKRAQLEKNDWVAPLSFKERQEARQEALTAQLQANVYQHYGQRAQQASLKLGQSHDELHAQDLRWQELGVTSSPALPMGVRFSQNPDYAACQAAFARITALSGSAGLSINSLDAIERIGVLHASALYERWCLVKIISILMENFQFQPERDWQDNLVHAVTGKLENLKLRFRREDIGLSALLEVQPVLPNGRRPDFRLRFKFEAPASQLKCEHEETHDFLSKNNYKHKIKQDGLVMDAKFRTHWRRGELESTLTCLVQDKHYDQQGDRVFILHPAPMAISKPTSPLAWGRDCNYGQELGISHKNGAIYLAPRAGKINPDDNLRRLIVMLLQATFPEPYASQQDKINNFKSNSFCINCGKIHQSEDIEQRLTKRDNEYWVLSCSKCKVQTTRTHCFGCKHTTLFKNSLNLTYHRTVADQPTNIVCPSCESYFDNEIHGDQNNEAGEQRHFVR